jgi:hypothetical protein
MVHEAAPLDVTNNPVLRALGEEVKRTRTTKVLSADGEELARVAPPRARHRKTRGKRITADDPIWSLTGIGRSAGGPTDVSAHVDAFLAAWEVAHNHR